MMGSGEELEDWRCIEDWLVDEVEQRNPNPTLDIEVPKVAAKGLNPWLLPTNAIGIAMAWGFERALI